MADKQITKLLEGQDLSEELMTQLQEAFDSEVQSKVDEQLEVKLAESKVQMDEAFDERVEELQGLTESYIQDEVIPTLSKYATAAVNEWLDENRETATSDAKVELAESFMKGLVGLVETQHLSIDVEDFSALEDAKRVAEDAKSELDAQVEKNLELKESLNQFHKERVVNKVCEELSESQRDKIMKVAEGLNFRDEEQFSERVESLVEDYGYRTTEEPVDESLEVKEPVKTVTEKTNSYESRLTSML